MTYWEASPSRAWWSWHFRLQPFQRFIFHQPQNTFNQGMSAGFRFLHRDMIIKALLGSAAASRPALEARSPTPREKRRKTTNMFQQLDVWILNKLVQMSKQTSARIAAFTCSVASTQKSLHLRCDLVQFNLGLPSRISTFKCFFRLRNCKGASL